LENGEFVRKKPVLGSEKEGLEKEHKLLAS
jgi:hypothetical protein